MLSILKCIFQFYTDESTSRIMGVTKKKPQHITVMRILGDNVLNNSHKTNVTNPKIISFISIMQSNFSYVLFIHPSRYELYLTYRLTHLFCLSLSLPLLKVYTLLLTTTAHRHDTKSSWKTDEQLLSFSLSSVSICIAGHPSCQTTEGEYI